MNPPRMSLGNVQGLLATGCFEDVISMLLQRGRGEHSNSVLIFDKENRLTPSLDWAAHCVRFCQRRFINARKVYLKRCTNSSFAPYVRPSAVLPYDAIDSGQSKSRPLASFFRRKKRLEDFMTYLVIHPTSRIGNSHQDVMPRLRISMDGSGLILAEFNVHCLDIKFAAFGHRIATDRKSVV